MSVSREAFREEIQQIIEDIRGGEGDVFLREISTMVSDAREHDPRLSDHLQDVYNSLCRTITYLKTKV